MLTVALCLVVLMPWNFPLWWQLHRLRYAIEIDCDAQVLEAGLDTRLYGEMLIDVSQRPSAYIGTVAAMAESRSFLEERIAIMVRDPAKWWSLASVASGFLALALVAVASQIAPPNVGNLAGSDQGSLILTPAVLDRHVGFYVRGGHTVFTVTRNGTRLLIKGPDFDSEELVPDSQMNFVRERSGLPLTFVRDAQGQTTGLLENWGGPRERTPSFLICALMPPLPRRSWPTTTPNIEVSPDTGHCSGASSNHRGTAYGQP